MCNERNSSNHSICYTTWTYEVHAFKNKNKRKSLRYIFVYHFIFYMFFRICNFRITETRLRHSLWWERDELINHSKYIIGSGRKQPPLFYNKSFLNFCNIHWKIPVLECLCNKELYSNFNKKRLQHSCFLLNIAEYLGKSVNGCFNQMLFRHNLKQSGFAQALLLKFLFQNKNIKIISKSVSLEETYFKILIYIMFI